METKRKEGDAQINNTPNAIHRERVKHERPSFVTTSYHSILKKHHKEKTAVTRLNECEPADTLALSTPDSTAKSSAVATDVTRVDEGCGGFAGGSARVEWNRYNS